MVQAAPNLGGLDASVMDAPLGQVRRVLTLIHDKAPKEDVDHELEELERGRESAILQIEAGLLWGFLMNQRLADAGHPVLGDRILRSWKEFDARTDYSDQLKVCRRLKSQLKGKPMQSRVARVIHSIEWLNKEKKRIGQRLRQEVNQLSKIEPSNRVPMESALLYKAALERRGLSPESTDMDIDLDDGTVVPIISTPLPATIAHRPADLAALEQTIHDEIEAAAPHLAGLVALRWSDADTAP